MIYPSDVVRSFDSELKLLTTSDGYIIESPLFFKQSADRIRRLNRMLSRKKKSNNRKRARLELVRAHKKIANQRQDYHFKLPNDCPKSIR